MDQIQDIQEDYIIEQLLASTNKPKDFHVKYSLKESQTYILERHL